MLDDDWGASPHANGILHCLKFLAQEAASLNLERTRTAIEEALEMAACEANINAMRSDVPRVQSAVH